MFDPVENQVSAAKETPEIFSNVLEPVRCQHCGTNFMGESWMYICDPCKKSVEDRSLWV